MIHTFIAEHTENPPPTIPQTLSRVENKVFEERKE